MPYFRLVIPCLLVLAASLLAACSPDKPIAVEEKLRPVRTFTVQTPVLGEQRQFPGVIDAAQKAVLSFRVGGKLNALSVGEGDFVTASQVLATLDPTDLKIQLADRQASFDRAKSDFTRAEQLVKAGHVSRSDYDKLKATLSTAKAQLELAQQNVIHAVLKAPFNGVVAKRYVENFEEISPQQTIFLLQDTSSLLVTIDVPESIMINTQRGEEPYELYAKFTAIPDEQFPLKIKEVSTLADDITQTYSVSFSMPAPKDHTILPGMSTVVYAEAKPEQQAALTGRFYLPGHAVLEDTQGNYVMLVQAIEQGVGQVERRTVTVGVPTVQGIEILSGVSQGDQVVIAGMSKLSHGQRVRLNEAQP